MEFVSEWYTKLVNVILFRKNENERDEIEAVTGSPIRTAKPSITCHEIHGVNVTLNHDSTIATRTDGAHDKALIFSSRKIRINELVTVKILEVTNRWSGFFYVGFTTVYPFFVPRNCLLNYRELVNMEAFWMRGIYLWDFHVGDILSYNVDRNGTVSYKVMREDGKEVLNEGQLLTEVDVSKPLWAVMELNGKISSIQWLDPPKRSNRFFPSILRRREQEVDVPVTMQRAPPRRTVRITPNPETPTHNTRSTRTRISVLIPPPPPILNLAPQPSPSIQPSAEVPPSLNVRRNGPNLACLSPPNLLLSPLSPLSAGTPMFMSPRGNEDMYQGLCIICIEKEKSTAFLYCGHLCMCNDCATEFYQLTETERTQNMRYKLCPICRAPIEGVLRIFY